MTLTAANAHGELIEQLDARVREIVRAEAVDPQRDAVLVRRIAEGVVRAHDDRSLTGGVAPVPDTDAVVGELVAASRASVRSSRSSTTPRSRRSGSTTRAVSSWPAAAGTSSPT